jgi:predicted ester cyclase
MTSTIGSSTDTSTIRETAERFFDACESGKGWEVCQRYCHPAATFSAQADALTGIETLEGYTNWLQGMGGALPDASYEIKAFAVDEARNIVLGFGVFKATHTGAGGPLPPTGKRLAADYVYAMEFSGDRIRHMTKIWNDVHSLKQLGWA